MASTRPFCLCVAGPNGSGKSTLAARLATKYALDNWIDPDEVAHRLAYQHRTEITDTISRQAFRDSRNARVQFAYQLQNFGFETVFSHGSNLAFLRALKAIGYDVHLYFVATGHPAINLERVRQRVAGGGHRVPEEKIEDRYYRSLQLLSLAIREFDRVVLYDNSRLLRITPEGSFAGRLVADIRNDAEGTRPEILMLRPPLPTWVLTHALFPYANAWGNSQQFRSIINRFGLEASCDIATDLDRAEIRRRFLARFLR